MKKGIEVYHQNGKRTVKGLGHYKTRNVENLKDLIKSSAEKYGDKIGFKFKDSKGLIIGKTYNEFDDEINCLGTALISMGLKNTHISILSENRYEWALGYFSIVNGAGVVVPLDKYLPQTEVENLIGRGGVEAIFYSPAFHNTMVNISKKNDNIKSFICFESLSEHEVKNPKFTDIQSLLIIGKTLIMQGETGYIDTKINENEMSILLFTSGTTSLSKGVMLSHKNVISNVIAISADIHVEPDDVHLSLLPLHHTFENTIGLIFMVYSGIAIAYSEGIRYLTQNIIEYNVSILVAVPALFEAIYGRIQDGIKKSGKAGIINLLYKVSGALLLLGIDLRKIFFKSIFKQIGPKLRLAVSGAAAIDPSVVEGFTKIGLRLVEGYGLTETSPVISANNDFVLKPGTIGHPLRGIEISILSPDIDGLGEIITRGPNVMLGYYNDLEATKDAIDEDGWFRTGDLGVIDEEGFTKVTGRAKSMIVFTNGKKAFPEEYEQLLNKLPGVKESFVWGNKAPDSDVQICAELILNKEWFEENRGKLLSENILKTEFEAFIKAINKTIPQYKIIRYFLLTYDDLIKTTTLKIKRTEEYEKIKRILNKEGIEMRKASGRLL
jgi:long-chain acyl-CoA synthetase